MANSPAGNPSDFSDVLLAYDTQAVTSIPKFRQWRNNNWTQEQSASPVNGEIRHLVLKKSPTRDEAVLAVLSSTGEISAQVWNGSFWSPSVLLGITDTAANNRDTKSLYRGFDLEYEQLSGDAVIVYGDTSADPDFRIWNGSFWSNPVNLDLPTTGRVNWLEMASRPQSDELALITLDANTDVYGLRWTGNNWDNMGDTAVWDATASLPGRKAIDVAFEQRSGDILFAWGDYVATQHYYRTFQNSTLSSPLLLTIPTSGGVCHWLKLAADPSGDKIIFGCIDAAADLNTALWDGTSLWTVHPEHDDSVENIVEMNFDLIFETAHPGDAWLLWGNGATISRRLFDSAGNSWQTPTISGDDTKNIALALSPQDGAILAAVHEDAASASDDITAIRLHPQNRVWSNLPILWTGPVASSRGLFQTAIASSPAAFPDPEDPRDPEVPGMNDVLLAYDTQTITSIPKFRQWRNNNWTQEQSASPVNGEIRHLVLKKSPTRDEAVLAVLSSTGEISAQVWNGSFWSPSVLLGITDTAANNRDTKSLYRGFDLEYEQLSGDAVIVYSDTSADPDFRIWNGSFWSNPVNLDLPTTGRVNWLEMASRPQSDELALITLDANTDVYGLRWTGNNWDNMGDTAVWDATASLPGRKAIDVAFEQQSGDILFAWGDYVATQHYYRTFHNSTLSSPLLLTIPTSGGVCHWLKLAADPSGDKIIFGCIDAAADLNTALWDGTSLWTVHPEHDDSVENIVEMNFDLIFETAHPGDAWLVWGNGATISRRLFDSAGNSWQTPTISGDDTKNIALALSPQDGAILAAVHEDAASASDDITAIRLHPQNRVWSNLPILWTGPVASTRGLFRTAIASLPTTLPNPDPGSLGLNIVNTQGLTVPSPTVTMITKDFSFEYQTSTGILGSLNEKIRIQNTTQNPLWTLSLAGSNGNNTAWECENNNENNRYDFNDNTPNAIDGSDQDLIGGLLTINPSSSTIIPQNSCSVNGLSKGPQASFSDTPVNGVHSITLLSSGLSAQTNCIWDLINVNISQTIPAEQPVGNYTIQMALTLAAS